MTVQIVPKEELNAFPMFAIVLEIVIDYLDEDITISPWDDDILLDKGIRISSDNEIFIHEVLAAFNKKKYGYEVTYN